MNPFEMVAIATLVEKGKRAYDWGKNEFNKFIDNRKKSKLKPEKVRLGSKRL